MKKILGLVLNAIVGLSFGFVGLAWAQSFNMPPPGGVAVIGCIYNSSPPTNTSGLPAFVQCDVNGQLKTTGGSGGGGAVTIANGANAVEGSTTDAAATTGSGTFTMKALLGGILNTLINNIYTTGTAGTPSTQVITVQGIAGGTGVTISPSTSTGAAVPSTALYTGGNAASSEPSKTTTGDLTAIDLDLAGKVITVPFSNRENSLRSTGSSTGTGAFTILAASGSASLNSYLTDITCTRNDTGTSAITITLSDSSAFVFDIPNSGGGGGFTKTFATPLVSSSTNTAITAASGTGVTTLHCSGEGFKGY